MKSKSPTPETIDEYINSHSNSKEIQLLLNSLRITIKNAAPNATEKICYKIPTFYLNGNLVHFAAYKNHIGFYPTSSGISAFQGELGKYQTSKGAVQFPIDKPLPHTLISKIVKFRVTEQQARA